MPFLQDDDVMLQFHVISSLAAIDTDEAKSLLCDKAVEGDTPVRIAAINALGRRQDDSLMGFLEGLSAWDDAEVDSARCEALARLQKGGV